MRPRLGETCEVVSESDSDGSTIPIHGLSGHWIASFLASVAYSYFWWRIYSMLFESWASDPAHCGLELGNNFNHLLSSILYFIVCIVIYSAMNRYGASKVVKFSEKNDPEDWMKSIEATFQHLEFRSKYVHGEWRSSKTTQRRMHRYAIFVIDPKNAACSPCSLHLMAFGFAFMFTFAILGGLAMFGIRCRYDTYVKELAQEEEDWSPLALIPMIVTTILGIMVLCQIAEFGYDSGWGWRMRASAELVRETFEEHSKESGSFRSKAWWWEQLTRHVSEEIRVETAPRKDRRGK